MDQTNDNSAETGGRIKETVALGSAKIFISSSDPNSNSLRTIEPKTEKLSKINTEPFSQADAAKNLLN
jgi:hypothetical protein